MKSVLPCNRSSNTSRSCISSNLAEWIINQYLRSRQLALQKICSLEQFMLLLKAQTRTQILKHCGAGNDEIKGGQEADVLFGGGDNDELSGGGGNDRLVREDGDDDLLGGEGDDRYMLDGLGDDLLDDPEGTNVARCAQGIEVERVEVINPNTGEQILIFNSGGTLTYYESELSSILGCNFTP